MNGALKGKGIINISLFDLGIIIIPILSINEIINLLLSGQIINLETISTPLIIKSLRDIILLVFVFYAIIHVLLGAKIGHKELYVIFVLISSSLLIFQNLLYTKTNIILIASYIRWFIPLFLPFCMKLYRKSFLKERYLLVTKGIYCIHIILQIIQLFFITRYGLNSLGLSIRNPGIFLIPNTAAGFSIVCYLSIKEMTDLRSRKKLALIFITLISVLLTGSGTGAVVLLLLLLTEKKKYRSLVLMSLPLIIILSLIILNGFFVRGSDYVKLSLGSRFIVFYNALTKSGFFPNSIGAGTNSAVLLKQFSGMLAGASIADSMPASILINMGRAGLLLFLPIFYYIAKKIITNKNNRLEFQTYLVIVLFSMTTIITEAYALYYPISVLIYWNEEYNLI